MGKTRVMSKCASAVLEDGKDLPVIRGSFSEEQRSNRGKAESFKA